MHVGMATIFLEIRRRVGNETFVGVDHPLAAHRLDSRAMYWTGRSADAYEGVSAFLEELAETSGLSIRMRADLLQPAARHGG